MAVVPDGRPSVTGYRVRERLTGWTLLELDLITGRTHQIRVHLDAIGHPIAGDPLVRHRDVAPGRRTDSSGSSSTAGGIELQSPTDGHLIRAEAPLPPELEAVLEGLRRRPATSRRSWRRCRRTSAKVTAEAISVRARLEAARDGTAERAGSGRGVPRRRRSRCS